MDRFYQPSTSFYAPTGHFPPLFSSFLPMPSMVQEEGAEGGTIPFLRWTTSPWTRGGEGLTNADTYKDWFFLFPSMFGLRGRACVLKHKTNMGIIRHTGKYLNNLPIFLLPSFQNFLSCVQPRMNHTCCWWGFIEMIRLGFRWVPRVMLLCQGRRQLMAGPIE